MKTAAHTLIPASALESVREKGLLSGKSLLEDPEALELVATSRGISPEELSNEIKERLEGWHSPSSLGPNIFFQLPPEGFELPEHHPSKQRDLLRVDLDLDALMKDNPNTRIHGQELVPYSEEDRKTHGDDYPHMRHHDLSPEELNELRGRSAEDLWKNMNKKFTGYAGDVPHASVITESGNIDPKYLQFPEKTAFGKMDQVTANYRVPDGDNICGNCIHFNGQNACDIVAGMIDPQMTCDYHEAIPASASNFEQFVPSPSEFKLPKIEGIPDPLKLGAARFVCSGCGCEECQGCPGPTKMVRLNEKTVEAIQKDIIPGGKADDKKPSDYKQEELSDGTDHELEHTSDPGIAQEIAMDHLEEHDDYYDMLADCEEKNANIVDDAAKSIEPNPTEAQKETGNYSKGHVNMHGLKITLENAKGGTRSGTSNDGKKWSVKMHHHYGYVKGSEGKDGDHVDVFVGDNPESELVVVINQVDPSTKKFDEHKVMLGFNNEKDAVEGYLKNYEKGWQGKGEVTAVTMKQFKWWLEHADTKKEVKNGYFGAPENVKKANVEDGQCCCVAPSSIHGRGAYAKQSYDPGDVIGEALTLLPPELSHNAEQREYLRTTVGRFVNHSQTQANTALVRNGDNFDLVAIRNIEPGEEMLADYVIANDLIRSVDTSPYDFHYDGYASPLRGYVDERSQEQEVDHQESEVQSPPAQIQISIHTIKTSNPFAKQAIFEKSLLEKSAANDLWQEVEDPPTVAIDLDGTLAEYDGFKGEDIIGDPRPYAKKMMDMYDLKGYKIIVFTCRGNKERVAEWLDEHEMPYHFINENPQQPDGTSNKVLADVYVDDKAVPADDLKEATKTVNKMLKEKQANEAPSPYLDSYMGRAWRATPSFVWDPKKNILQNTLSHFGKIQDKAKEFQQHDEAFRSFEAAKDPGKMYDRFRQALRGNYASQPSNTLDQVLLSDLAKTIRKQIG